MSGWNLSVALITKHFGKLGDSIAEALASFDPETATQVDRDNLQAKLREVATKMAEARRKYDIEQREAVNLAALIATDEKAAEILIAKFEKGEIDEATLNEFSSNLEAEKARLPGEQQDVSDAKALVDTLQDILNTVEQRLGEFDQHAKEALRAIAQAQAEKERQELRLQHQSELREIQTGLGGASTALGALAQKAEKLRVEAEASRSIADVGQKPLDRNNAVEEARKLASGAAPATCLSAVERLRAAAAAKQA